MISVSKNVLVELEWYWYYILFGSECIRVERHVYSRTVVSVSYHYKNPTKRSDLVQRVHHHRHYLIKFNLVSLWYSLAIVHLALSNNHSLRRRTHSSCMYRIHYNFIPTIIYAGEHQQTEGAINYRQSRDLRTQDTGRKQTKHKNTTQKPKKMSNTTPPKLVLNTGTGER